MDKKSKILLIFLLLMILTSIYLSYDRTIIRKDFEVTQSEEFVEEEVTIVQDIIEATSTEAVPAGDVATTTP